MFSANKTIESSPKQRITMVTLYKALQENEIFEFTNQDQLENFLRKRPHLFQFPAVKHKKNKRILITTRQIFNGLIFKSLTIEFNKSSFEIDYGCHENWDTFRQRMFQSEYKQVSMNGEKYNGINVQVSRHPTKYQGMNFLFSSFFENIN